LPRPASCRPHRAASPYERFAGICQHSLTARAPPLYFNKSKLGCEPQLHGDTRTKGLPRASRRDINAGEAKPAENPNAHHHGTQSFGTAFERVLRSMCLDRTEPRRDLRRARDQRLSAGRDLIGRHPDTPAARRRFEIVDPGKEMKMSTT